MTERPRVDKPGHRVAPSSGRAARVTHCPNPDPLGEGYAECQQTKLCGGRDKFGGQKDKSEYPGHGRNATALKPPPSHTHRGGNRRIGLN